MTPTILIVEDEPDMLQLLKRSLEPELNCMVVTAPSAEKGLKHLEQGSFDLVLADIKMPGMNGLDFLQMIKHDYPQQTVVMMTAFGQIDMAVEAIRSGAYDFITKPFEHDTLVLRLDKALERSRLIYDTGGCKPGVRNRISSKKWWARARPCSGYLKPFKCWLKPITPY